MCSLLRSSLALLACALVSNSVFGAPIVNDRTEPVNVLNGPEVPVQQIFNSLFQSGSGFVAAPNVATDQSNIASFHPTTATVFTILAGYAGYRPTNIFGIYEVDNRAERIVFGGGAADGTETVGYFSSSAQLTDFGWFLDVAASGGYRVYSDDTQNPGGLPQMVVFVGNGQTFQNPNLGYDGIFNTYDIIIAIEDLKRINGGSDNDFNDLIVLIENVQWGQPIPPNPDFEVRLPEPGSMALWGLLATLGGVSCWRRKRRPS